MSLDRERATHLFFTDPSNPRQFMGNYTETKDNSLLMQRSLTVIDAIDAMAKVDKPNCAKRIVSHYLFQAVCAIAIVANSVVLALASNSTMENLAHPDGIYSVLEAMFTIFYFGELILRIAAHQLAFVFGQDWAWNLFDTVLVSTAIWDLLYTHLGDSQDSKNMSSLRGLRLIKAVKVFRLVRMLKLIRELRLLVRGIFGTMRPLFWTMMLLTIMTYIHGILFLQASAEYLMTTDDIDPSIREGINRYWSSVPEAMLSLFMANTTGQSWEFISAL